MDTNFNTPKKEVIFKVKTIGKGKAIEVNVFGTEPEKYWVIRAAGTMIDTIPTINQDWINWKREEDNLKTYKIAKNSSGKRAVKNKEFNARMLGKKGLELISLNFEKI